MNKELVQEIKNYNFLEKLKVDYYVDAVDEGRWKVGKIVGFKSLGHRHTVTVRFDGHTSRWNEDYDLPSYHKLAPFRRHSLPYTGPWTANRQIYRDAPSLNFQGPLKELNRVNAIQKMKPDMVNQVYRGELFILVDNILTRKATLPKEDFLACLDFFKAYIQAGIKIMKYALEKMPEISALNITDPTVIYVSTPHALVYSLTEFLFNFNSLINSSQFRVKFYTINEGICTGSELRKDFKKFMIENSAIETCKKIMEYQNPPYRGFSWSIKKEVLIFLSNFEQKNQFPKINDVRQITDILDYLSYMSLKSAFSPEIVESKQIELIITLITSGNFEGKLKGLNEMKKIVEDIRMKPKVLQEHISKANLLEVLTENSSFNGQLFKRSLPIFQFAEKHDLLNQQILVRILNLHKDKHELELKSFYGTLAQFGKFLNQKKVLTFFQHLKKFPIEEHWVNLIKEYTLTVADSHPVFKRKYMDSSSGLGVIFLWEIIEGKREKLAEELMDKVIKAFSELLVNDFYKKETEKYVSASIYGIKEKRNMDSYFKIIHNSLSKNRDFAKIIEKIDRELNIVETVVNSVISSEKLSIKAVENMFQFLEEVNHYAQKKMTVQHIKVLWNLPGCRNSLLKFMRKYRTPRGGQEKSTDKILSKQLGNAQIREIIEKIFLNSDLMGGYANISSETYQTADQLIVCYNHNMKTIDYNYKHTIRCERPDEMQGLNFYMNVIANCEDGEMVDKCLTRFIEFYIRPVSKSYLQSQKIPAWNSCVKQLSKIQKQKYRGYEIFFEQIIGRMKSLTILDSSTVNLSILNKATREKKLVSLPRNSSLWKLRAVINDLFDLKGKNFQMFYTVRRSSFDMEREQDFSLAYIEVPKDPALSAVMITPLNEIHPHYTSIEDFKKQFSTTYAESLYEDLTKSSDENQQIILKVLLTIPALKSLEKKMTKLEFANWQEILEVQGRVKLAYQLSLISKIKGQGMQWAMSFIKKGGVEHLQKIFLTRSKADFNSFDYKIFTDLMGIFVQMLKFYKTVSQNLPFSEQFILEMIKLPKKTKQQEIMDYFYTAFTAIKEATNFQHIKCATIFQNSIMTDLLENLLFCENLPPSAARFPETMIAICDKGKCFNFLEMHMGGFMNFAFLKKQRNKCTLFFNLLVMMLEKDLGKEGLFQKAREFITIMRNESNIVEEDETKPDALLFGWLKVIECFAKKNKKGAQIKIFHEPEQKFALYLINEGLFNKIHRLRSSETRVMAYQVLSSLQCEQEILDLIGGISTPIMQKGSWRKQFEWYVKSFKKRKAEDSVGIKNLAATCYINSLLQQLFHIRQFSQPLFGIDTKSIDDNENIAYQVQKIFAHLKYSDNDVYTTESLCRNFILDGQPIDPRIQTDVDEFFHSLMDKLERNLAKVDKKDLIDNVFRGEYSNLIIGQECPHKSERIEHFLSMRLQIINKKSLLQALEEFIKGEILEGDNAYFCEKCDKKVKALKRVCVKSLPDVLILTLKRFEFDFDKMQKFKLNSYCEFPEDLNMFPYMRDALQNQQMPNQKDYQYRLKGIVIHYGISEAGHYTSYVRTSEKEWKYFDDDRIYPFDFKDLGKECFGGTEQNFYSQNTEKLKNAYLLIYEKVTIKEPEAVKVHPTIKAEVEEENQRNQEVKVLFEEGFLQFMDSYHKKMSKTYLIYVHLVLLRSQKRNKNLATAYNNCIQILEGNPGLMGWYLNQFSQNLIRELLIYAHLEVSHFVVSLVCCCLESTVDIEFIRRCMKCIQMKNMVPFIKIFQKAVRSNVQYQKGLSEFSYSEKIYRIIKENKPPNPGSTSKIANVRSEFGQADTKFIEKKDYRDSVELIQAIEGFKLNMSLEDIEDLCIRAKKLATQQSLAKAISVKFKDEEGFVKVLQNFILPKLVKEEPKLDQEYTFVFVLILMGRFAEIKDDLAAKRLKYLSKVYIDAICQSIDGYKAMRYLLEGLFNTCFTNSSFLDEIVQTISSHKESKKLIKAIREWIKEGDRFYALVKAEKMGYWRKPDRRYYVSKACLEQIEDDEKLKPDRYLSLFNSLLEKHKIDYEDHWNPSIKIGQIVTLRDYEETQIKVTDKVGLLLKVGQENKFVPEGDVIITRSY